MSILLADIGWAAGFYEGEGSFIEPGYVSIVQKDIEPLVKMHKLFGGQFPKIYNGYWYWRIYDLEMRQFIFTIFTFLSKRRRKQILEFKNIFTELDKCPNGHIYPPNVKSNINNRTGGLYRSCITCRRAHQLRKNIKRRANNRALQQGEINA